VESKGEKRLVERKKEDLEALKSAGRLLS